MKNKKLALIAFGGNALLRAGQIGTIEEQKANVYETCENLLDLIKSDYNIVIAHGNGPQVGNILLQVNAGKKLYNIPEMPLDICGAYSQGFIGYLIEQQFKNVLAKNGFDKNIITIVSQVLVDEKDKAFQNPTKPIGPYYSEEEMKILKSKNPNDNFAKDPKGKGWRKVVASPKPIDINNKEIVEALARQGNIVISVGGGGIPIILTKNKNLQGVEAVIDKDLASSMLAVYINADEFYILTDVPKVCLNFNSPDEKSLDTITVNEAKQYLEQAQFTEGSMAPKIRAAINFIENGGKTCIITEASQLNNPLAGTRIVR
ncbi:MAG: carbamate kinase [Bacteroidales bacterium]|jgi:carbamate kinase|nr:carbamate kinase [Bacteroidales bacterium]MCK9498155.1 carbamate kinase [Bacteroidales bacterium]MDY0315187.1 carbamate kinase [Bacteroidales bacterium]NLB86670.1 carbamate kinase [Bacteroidales bacterium]